tara:strand:+ start:453 stop:839 length:387 start_codon:yes stop_codon:yes gene_type:complete
MKPSIKFKSIGGATLQGNFGSNLAGDFNIPLDLIGAFDYSYAKSSGATSAFCILLKGENNAAFGATFAYNAMYIYISGTPTATGSYNDAGVNEAIAKAISNHSGTGEAIVTLPEGINCLGWEYFSLLY